MFTHNIYRETWFFKSFARVRLKVRNFSHLILWTLNFQITGLTDNHTGEAGHRTLCRRRDKRCLGAS